MNGFLFKWIKHICIMNVKSIQNKGTSDEQDDVCSLNETPTCRSLGCNTTLLI